MNKLLEVIELTATIPLDGIVRKFCEVIEVLVISFIVFSVVLKVAVQRAYQEKHWILTTSFFSLHLIDLNKYWICSQLRYEFSYVHTIKYCWYSFRKQTLGPCVCLSRISFVSSACSLDKYGELTI